MDSVERMHAAADAVLAIEQAMREGGYWHTEVPSPAAMASRTPFCADTLSFTQWLQFIFIPKMRDLLESGAALPAHSGIAVMAEQKLDANPAREILLTQLRAFDTLIEHDS